MESRIAFLTLSILFCSLAHAYFPYGRNFRRLPREHNGTAILNRNPDFWTPKCKVTGNPYVAVVNDEIWRGPKTCGKEYVIRCKGPIEEGAPTPCLTGDTRVTVFDYCPHCAATFAILEDDFDRIAQRTADKINIGYTEFYYW